MFTGWFNVTQTTTIKSSSSLNTDLGGLSVQMRSLTGDCRTWPTWPPLRHHGMSQGR